MRGTHLSDAVALRCLASPRKSHRFLVTYNIAKPTAAIPTSTAAPNATDSNVEFLWGDMLNMRTETRAKELFEIEVFPVLHRIMQHLEPRPIDATAIDAKPLQCAVVLQHDTHVPRPCIAKSAVVKREAL